MGIFDLHCDTLYRLYFEKKKGRNSLRENEFHVDLKRLKEVGGIGQFFAIYFNAADKNTMKEGTAFEIYKGMYNLYKDELEKNKDIVSPLLTKDDIDKNISEGKISSLLSLEGAEPLEGKIENLQRVYEDGVRAITLCWNNENELAYPHTDNKNLKEFGIECVKKMDELGMIVDVSHLSDKGFWDVVNHSTKPFIASHSNSRELCGHSRNLNSEMIKALGDKGGVTGLNFYRAFLGSDEMSRVEEIVDHGMDIIDKGGEDVLGIGSDFDGIGGTLEVDGIGNIELLRDAFKKRGLTSTQIDKIFSGNILRVLKETLRG